MKTLQFLTVIGATAAATLFQANAAQALTFNLNQGSSSGDVYNYDVTLDAGETLTSGIDSLALTGLGSVTSATTDGSTFSVAGFDESSANFLAAGTFTGAQSFTNAITLTAPGSTTGDINFTALTGGTGGGSFAGTAQGPIADATAVPFELSPNIGLFTIFGIIGLNYYRKKFKAQ